MPLKAKADNPPERSFSGIDCSVGHLLATLEADEAAALQVMLDDPKRWTANMVYDAVTDEGHLIGRQSIGRHRRGTCRCFRDKR